MLRVGIDLGGTNIAAGVVDDKTNCIIGRANVKTDLPRSAEKIADSIAEVARLATEDAGVSFSEIASIGIGTPGAVNADGVVEFSSNLGFDDTPLKMMVFERTGKNIFIENDANCAAIGEQLAGCGDGVENFIAVTLGTGVGGGIVINNRLLTGINGAAGEIGHIVIRQDGIACPCGRHGCFEQYASATALIRRAKDALTVDREHNSKMWDLIGGDADKVDGKVVFDSAHAGDEIALKVIDEYLEYLACGVANLINIFQPEIICIGGGISKQGDYIIKPLVEKVERERYTKHSKVQTKICAAILGNDAGIIGAALLK